MQNIVKGLAALPLVLAFVLFMHVPLHAEENSDVAAEPDAAPQAEADSTPQAEADAAPQAETDAAPKAVAAPQAETEASTTPFSSGIKDYILGVGDKLRINVFGEPDLTGEFEVSSTGIVSMPLIGDVRAAGQTVSKLQASITAKLKDGYMKDPKVSVEVNNYRPFFIVGEVMKPGSYTYVNGMTVINAVALAGGYTYRADKSGITLKHGGPTTREASVPEDSVVLPGDVIRVPERFF